jgi:putative addiction module component (TIGR02574 family)
MAKGNLISSILQLSVAERIRLVQEIWDSIADLPEATTLTEEQKYELDRRLAAIEKSPKGGESWEKVLSDLRSSR